PHCEVTSECLPRHPAVAYLFLVRAMRPLIVILAVFCVTSYAGPLPDSLLDKKVTFTIPAKWIIQRQFTKESAEVLQILIPDPGTDDTPDSSNAILTAEQLQTGVNVQRFGDSRLQHVAVVTDIPAGQPGAPCYLAPTKKKRLT